MREDMDRVIVERARYGSDRGGARGARERRFDDDASARETNTQRARRRSKEQSDHLAPLRRFLEGNVGRPWDKVFSEVCARLRLDGTLQRHVRDHVERDLVITDAVLVDGVPCHPPHRSHGGPRPIRRRSLYVCPRTGRLLRPRVAKVPALRPRCTSIDITPDESYELRDGVWLRVTWARLEGPARDALTGRALAPGQEGIRAGQRYASSKRQVGGRELRDARTAAAGRRVPRLRARVTEVTDDAGVVRYELVDRDWRVTGDGPRAWTDRHDRAAISAALARFDRG